MTNSYGEQLFNQDEIFKCLTLQVFYNKDSIANVLSLKDVGNLEEVIVHMDLSKKVSIHACQVVFKESENGLHAMSIKDIEQQFYYNYRVIPVEDIKTNKYSNNKVNEYASLL